MSANPTRLLLSRRSIIAAAAGLAGAAGAGKCAIAQSDLPAGDQVLHQVMPAAPPPLSFTDVKGHTLGPAAFAGHGLVINFWATWCGPCVAELPSLVAIAPALAKAGVLVLPVSVDLTGMAAVRPFYQSHAVTGLPMFFDPNGTTLDSLGAGGIPVTIVLDAKGRLVARYDGAADWNTPGTIQMLRQLAGGAGGHDDGGIERI